MRMMQEQPGHRDSVLLDAVTELQRGTDDLPIWVALAAQSGGPVLECGAGTGRVLAVLLEAGVDAYGIEHSEEARQVGLRRLQAMGFDGPRHLSPGDMTCFSHDRRYRLVVIPLNTVALLSDEDFHSTLRCIEGHLHSEGELAFDLDLRVVPPEGADPGGWKTEATSIQIGEGKAHLSQWFKKTSEGQWQVEHHFDHADGSHSTVQLSLVVRSLERVTELLGEAGWTVRMALDEHGGTVDRESRISFVLSRPDQVAD